MFVKIAKGDYQRAAPAGKVSLAPPPEGLDLPGVRVLKVGARRVARLDPARLTAAPVLVEAEIETSAVTPAGDYITTRARVWRVADRRAWAYLTPDMRAALLAYAETVETVGASGGTLDPTSAPSGSRSTPTGPAAAKMDAARRLRAMDAALAGGALTLVWCDGDRRVGRRQSASLPYADLVQWVAVECMTRTDILRRLGVAHPEVAAGEAPGVRVMEAVADCALRVMPVAFGFLNARGD